MHHVAELLSQNVSVSTLERLVRVELVCLREADGSCLGTPDGDGVFALKGHVGRRGATLLHVFDDEASDMAELLMALVEDNGVPFAYKDAETEEDFDDLSSFGAWLEGQEGPQMLVVKERMLDIL